ncbi:hypothetical protein BO85DRAFT_44837 [Aspergillus piperis CBS 112811]|uniref:Uncharacterized protein n=1 Tax=Aspergillus piperis CBS 112811 TaxID=1448313 RepID=A0A8G1R365_9EURO|nr:hypothetical protein BO85DRAFT_44837 [Aspergillus piperis CBS 112811]RAH56910.1 hypothetical protein BO85DRAFT_44837 [Aspergillus piperis CBS 112811]
MLSIEPSFGPNLAGYALMFSLLFPQIFFTCISWCISQRLFSSGRKNLGCFLAMEDLERTVNGVSVGEHSFGFIFFILLVSVFVWVAAAIAVALVLFNIHCRFRSVSVYR